MKILWKLSSPSRVLQLVPVTLDTVVITTSHWSPSKRCVRFLLYTMHNVNRCGSFQNLNVQIFGLEFTISGKQSTHVRLVLSGCVEIGLWQFLSILFSYSTGILPFFSHQAMQRLCLPRDILRYLVLVQLPKSNGKKNGKNKKLTLLRVKRSRPKGQQRYNNIRGTC